MNQKGYRVGQSLFNSVPFFKFSSFSSLRWTQSFEGRFTPVDSIQDPRSDQFYIMRLNLVNQVQIRFKLDSTLSYLSEALQKSEGNQVEKVNFYSIAGSRLPLCEKIQDLTDMPIFCQVNDNRVFALNFSQEFDIRRIYQSSPITDEEHFFDFASGIGLKGYQKFLFSNFAHKLMHALPTSQNSTKREEIGESLAQVFRFYQRSGHQPKYSGANAKMSEQKDRLAQLEDSVAARQYQLNQLQKSASRKSTILCLFGSSIVISQFAFIAAGTFHYLSWDIMEPICYLMTFGNFTFSYFFYLGMKRDLELTNIHEILTYRFQQRAAKRLGIDLKQHEAEKQEIQDINESLKQAYNV